MPIPDYQTIMLPLLKIHSDGKEHIMKDVSEELSRCFNLTEEEKLEMLPSGKRPVFASRVGWAKTYLKKAGLLHQVIMGTHIITQRGIDLLKTNPVRIDNSTLKKYPEFLEFYSRSEDNATVEKKEPLDDKTTPEEALEDSYRTIRRALAQEVLQNVKTASPAFFETLVVELLVKMGYGGSIKDAGKAIGRSGDEGIDGMIKEDKLGLDVIYIQAKRWDGSVGRPEIQKFVGALAGQGAKKGIFITTGKFTNEAKEYLPKNDTKIVLVDGNQLAEYMIDYNLGVASVSAYEVKRIDSDYFGEE